MTEHNASDETGVNGPENIDRAAMRLRRVLLFPLLWIFFMVNVPDVIMGILDTKSKWANSLGDISAIIIMGIALLYLLFAIKQEKKVLRLLMGGVVLVVISQTIRITRIFGGFDGLHGTPYEYGYQLLKVLDEACSGMGMVLITAAFFTAIVDLYAAKRRLALQREDLSREVCRRAGVEKEIIQEKQRYKDLIQNLPVAVYRNTPGPEGHFLEVNPAHVTMLEAESEENLMKINVSDLYRTASDRRRIADKLMQEGSVKNEEIQLVTLKGRPITGSVTAVLKHDSSGQPYFDGIIEDITARVEAMKLLEEQRAKLVENARLAALGIMAGGIAHEIYNPLAVIEGCAERLDDHVNTLPIEDAVLKKYLDMIVENAGRIHKIIQGLRSISRDASKDPFIKSSLDVIMGSVLELCRERFFNNNISFDVEMPDPDLKIECRPAQIGQVIINLLNNAYDAVQTVPEKRIRLGARERESGAEITVEDSGEGVPSEIAGNLFIPFFTTKSEGSGVGLGLSISHAIVKEHHGDISVDSAHGYTRFSVFLPYVQPAEDAAS